MPQVSVLMPSLNQSEFIETAIRSVLEQTAVPLELVVCDGGSTDGTQAVLERLAVEFAPRLIWISSADAGPASAVNKALSLARGEIIGWLNADDVYATDAVSVAFRMLSDSAELVMLYGEAEHIDAHGRTLGRYQTRPPSAGIEAFQAGCFICQPTVFLRRRVLHQLGGLNEELRTAFDFELWLRLFADFPSQIGYTDRVQAYSRVHGRAITSQQRRTIASEAVQLLSRYLGYAQPHWILTYMEEASRSYPSYGHGLNLSDHILAMLEELAPCMEEGSLVRLRSIFTQDRRMTAVPKGVHADMFPDGWAGRELSLRARSPLRGSLSLVLDCENYRPLAAALKLTVRTNRGAIVVFEIQQQKKFEINIVFSNVMPDELLFASVHTSPTFVPKTCEPGSTDGRELAFRVSRIRVT